MRERLRAYLKAHRDVTPRDLLIAESMEEGEMQLPSDEDARRIKRMVNEVRREYHYLKGFIRLEEPREGILIGYASPRHRIKQMLASYFSYRFPGNLVVVGDERTFCISIFSNAGHMCQEVRGSLTVLKMELGGEEKDEVTLWETYFFSQYNPLRRNPELFKNRMPKRYRDEAGLRRISTGHDLVLDNFQ